MNYNVTRSGTGHFAVYLQDDGSTRLLGIASVDLSEFGNKTIEISGTGVLGSVEMITPGAFDSMEVTIHWQDFQDNLSELMSPRGHDLCFRSAEPVYDGATGDLNIEKVKLDVRGLTKKTPLGKMEQASTTDSETTLEVIYLKLTVNGKVLIELDKLNYIFIVNGKDYMEETREALAWNI